METAGESAEITASRSALQNGGKSRRGFGDDLLSGEPLLHVQSPLVWELDSRSGCYSKTRRRPMWRAIKMKIDEQAFDVLRSMSWSESRRINPAPFVAALQEEGYRVFPAAISFIEKFGGLSGKMPGYRLHDSRKEVHFDPLRAIQNIYREKVIEYECRVGEPLVAIGESDNMHMTLLISETGRILAGYDDELFLLGNDPIEGLNALLGNKEATRIP